MNTRKFCFFLLILLAGCTTDRGELDVIVELGQSNMEGRDGDLTDPEYPFTSSSGFFWNGTTNGEISTTRGGAVGGSHANYFAEKHYELSGRKALLVESATGGSGLTPISSPNENWSESGGLREEAIEQVENALQYNNIASPRAVLWAQGERDAITIDQNPSYTKEIVKAAMQEVVNWWFIIYPNSVFIISELGATNLGDTPGWRIMRQVQNEIAEENPKVFIGFNKAKDFPVEGKMSDNYHYNFQGYKQMGEALAEFLVNLNNSNLSQE